jgi:hypothetical protein
VEGVLKSESHASSRRIRASSFLAFGSGLTLLLLWEAGAAGLAAADVGGFTAGLLVHAATAKLRAATKAEAAVEAEAGAGREEAADCTGREEVADAGLGCLLGLANWLVGWD